MAIRKQSRLQKICMQYGQDCRALSNSYLLARFLTNNGKDVQAQQVLGAIATARDIARNRYFRDRKEIQPDWRDWTEQTHEGWNEAVQRLEQEQPILQQAVGKPWKPEDH